MKLPAYLDKHVERLSDVEKEQAAHNVILGVSELIVMSGSLRYACDEDEVVWREVIKVGERVIDGVLSLCYEEVSTSYWKDSGPWSYIGYEPRSSGLCFHYMRLLGTMSKNLQDNKPIEMNTLWWILSVTVWMVKRIMYGEGHHDKLVDVLEMILDGDDS